MAAWATVPSAGAAASASACFAMPRWTLVSTSRWVRTGGPGGRVTAYVVTSATTTTSATRPHQAPARHPGQPGADALPPARWRRFLWLRVAGASRGSPAPAAAVSAAVSTAVSTAVSRAEGAVTRATFSTIRFIDPGGRGLSRLHRITRSKDASPGTR